ncbi:MAG TPA: hypothetical protein P5186_25160 [Candidatus Paceibacterota bacterium]|nr:hypothetical protein [Verrucomicrobiota bacterium]HRY51353.1 hypothetical protein [Candidatus Paceibacterota bacterium]HSA03468.1 hypothetical protein [Candidatus Paceibacterota bacterium]
MEFLKNHYEKVLLSVVLLALAVVTALLPSKAKTIESVPTEPPAKKSFEMPDVGTNKTAIARLENPTPLVWDGPHNVFNPVKWKRRPNGMIEKILSRTQEGPHALQILRITPLHFILSFDSVVGSAANLRYQFGITREAETNASLRRKIAAYAVVGEKTDYFTLKDLKGAPESPTELRLELTNGVSVNVSKESPFRRVDGHAVDLRYPPEDKVYTDRRKGDTLILAGETNNIVAIFEDKVVLSAHSTGERTTVTNIVNKAGL